MNLCLGGALYYNTDLSTAPAPLRALWAAVTEAMPAATLFQWTGTAGQVGTKKPFDLAKLEAAVVAGATSAAVESKAGLLIRSDTTPAAKRSEPLVPRPWLYDTAIAIPAPQRATEVITSLVEFADAVGVAAGILYWTHTAAYASALATGGIAGSLTADEERRVRDSHDRSNHWARIIRGPAWGTFLGAAHVAQLGDVTRLPASRVVPLRSGGAFVQLTAIAEATAIDEPSPQLDQLRGALAGVLDG